MSEETNQSDELTRVFADGSVFQSSDKDLDRYLAHLCSDYVPNENVRHRAINRCQVVNTIKTFRFINSLKKTNKIFTAIIVILTIATVALSYYSTRITLESGDNTERLIAVHEKYLSDQQTKFETQLKRQENAYRMVIKSQNQFMQSIIKEMASNNATQMEPPPSSALP
jgi:hypothetical protein